MNGSFLFWVFILGFSSGILFRSFFIGAGGYVPLFLLVSIGLALIWSIKKAMTNSFLCIISILLLGSSGGVLRMEWSENKPLALSEYEGAHVILEGVVVREPDVREKATLLTIRPYGMKELVLVTLDRFTTYEYGERIEIKGVLEKPDAFETDTGRTFEYGGYLKARGIHHIISYGSAEIHGEGEGNRIIEGLLRIKHAFMNGLERVLNEPAAGLGEGLLLGSKRALGDELEQSFRDTGIIHIVVLSGYNIFLIVTFVMLLFARVVSRTIASMVVVIVIVLFAFLVGLSASVVRASLMAILLIIANMSGRTYDIMRALGLVFIGMLLVNPYLIAYDPGFVLSFLATFGLIVIGPFLEKKLSFVPAFLEMRTLVSATLATQCIVLPYLLYQMGSVSVVAVVVNILVLPAVPLAMLLTFLTGMSAFIYEPIGILIGFVTGGILDYIVWVARIFQKFPFATITVPEFPLVALVAVYVIGGFIFLHTRIPTIHFQKRNKHQKEGHTVNLSEWTVLGNVHKTEGTRRTQYRNRISETPRDLPFK